MIFDKIVLSALRLDHPCFAEADRALHVPFSHMAIRPIELAKKIALLGQSDLCVDPQIQTKTTIEPRPIGGALGFRDEP